MALQEPQASLTPEQQKAMRGPSAEDPLEDEGAASWVQQFNEELARPSINALECATSPVYKSRFHSIGWAGIIPAACVQNVLTRLDGRVFILMGVVWQLT